LRTPVRNQRRQVRQARIVEVVGVTLFLFAALRVAMTALFAILYGHGFEGAVDAGSIAAVGLVAVVFLAPLIPTRKHAPMMLMLAALIAAVARPVLNINELIPRY